MDLRQLRGAVSGEYLQLQTALTALALLLVAFFLSTVIYGAFLNYSSVPFLDSWTGMVDFYLKSKSNPSVWWSQHNEHRIFISKLLFWLDMRYLQGSGLLLIPLNILFLLLTWWVLTNFANKLIRFSSLQERIWVCATLGMLCLAWMQCQNIISSFQNQFILVFLFPLGSFYCLACAQQSPERALLWRALSLILGAVSAFSMANGIFALPVLALLSWYSERSPRWFLITLWCALITIGVFLVGYEKSPSSVAGFASLKGDPLQVVGYALAYLGAPAFIIFGRIGLAVAAGGVAVVLALYVFLRQSPYRSKPFALALCAFIGYVFAGAAVTAYGRAFFALENAASSRYLTPVLIMWAALFILMLAQSQYIARLSAVTLVIIGVLLVPVQMRVFTLDTGMYTPQLKAVAALGLQLDIDDLDEKKLLYFFYDASIEDIFRRARDAKVSIFSEKYAYPANQIGKSMQDVGGESCAGQITYSKLVDQKHVAYRIGGSIAGTITDAYRYVLFSDVNGLVKGVAIPGRDVPGASGDAGALNFDGYLFGTTDFQKMSCLK